MKKIKNGFFITVEGIDGSGKSSVVNFLSSALANRDFNVIKTREPGGTKLGAALREIIIGAAAEPGAIGAVGTFGPAKTPKQSQAQELLKCVEVGNIDHMMPIPLAIDSAELSCPDQRGTSARVIDSKAEFLLFAADRAQHLSRLIKPGLDDGSIIISDRGSDSSLAYQGYGKGLDLDMIYRVNNWILGDTKPDLVIYLKLDYKTAIDRVVARGAKITAFEKKGREFFDRVINGFNEIFSLRSKEVSCSIMEIDASQSAEAVKEEVLDKVLKIIMLKELI